MKSMLNKVFQRGGVYISLILLLIISGIISPNTVTPMHLLRILRVASILGIMSIGQTLLIISKGIDLSVGAHATLIMVIISGITLGNPKYTFLVIIICLLAGLLIGFINGLLVVKFNIEPLVGSLGVSTLITGVYYLYTKGFAAGVAPPFIHYVGTGTVFGFLPVSLIIWAILSGIVIFILKRTIFGRYIYACGANPEAAFTAGIKVSNVRILIYMVSGLLTAISGLVLAGFLNSPTLVAGSSYPLDSIAAVIIGGTTFAGGKGNIGGTVAGSVVIVFLASFLTIIGLGQAGKFIFQGLIILVLVFIYTGRKK